ncbi:MAG: hypothetical protein RBR08_10835 [Desulforegulaceae bacterium]|nr:hypothetical protein [Desulforegulaceae bacterium]
MNKYFILTCFALIFIFVSGSYGNPFKSSENMDNQPFSNVIGEKSFLLKITILQQKLKINISSLISDFKTEKKIYPLISVLLISFFYGAVHAAGPGHGKSFAAAYILTHKPGISKALVFGTAIAFFHGISGALVVLLFNFILKKTISGTVNEIEYITTIISYLLICLLGLILFLKAGLEIFCKKKQGENKIGDNIYLWGFSAGLIPCPGVIMIMLFCLSMGLPFFGFFLSFAVSFGMAVTICFVILIILYGKKVSFSFISEKKAESIEKVLTLLSGFFVFMAGIVFLLSSLEKGKYF